MTHDTGQALDPGQIERFNHEGYLILRGLFSPEEAGEIRETFMRQNADGPIEGLSETRRIGMEGGYDRNDPLSFFPRMMNPHRHADKPVGPLTMRFMLEPRLHGPLRDLFGDEPVATQSMFYFKPPGARGQDLHQDNFYLRVKPGTCMAAWIAVDDADEDNGGMLVVPGTSHLDIACPEKSDPTKYFTTEHVEPPPGLKPVLTKLKAGDVLFFNGSLIHGSHPNTSRDRFRRSLICHYVPRGTTEMSHWYHAPLAFDGTRIDFRKNEDGGPCGTPVDEVVSPH